MLAPPEIPSYPKVLVRPVLKTELSPLKSQVLVQLLSLLLNGCVTQGKPLDLSVLFFHLPNGNDGFDLPKVPGHCHP